MEKLNGWWVFLRDDDGHNFMVPEDKVIPGNLELADGAYRVVDGELRKIVDSEPSTLWAAKESIARLKFLLREAEDRNRQLELDLSKVEDDRLWWLNAYNEKSFECGTWRRRDKKRSKAARRVAEHARKMKVCSDFYEFNALSLAKEAQDVESQRDRLIENWPCEEWCDAVHYGEPCERCKYKCDCNPQQRARRIAKGEHESGK